MIKKSFIFLLGVLLSYSVSAQCGTDEFLQELLESDSVAKAAYYNHLNNELPGYMENRANFKNKAGKVWVIPVVFHVVHEYGEENISREQILNQMETLNEDFRRTNSDTSNTQDVFKSIASDMEFEFRFARVAPDGSCTGGIVRYESELTDGGDELVKQYTAQQMKWDYRKYLNIWVVKRIERNWNPPSFVAGYAVFPNATNSTTDGVILRHDYIGSIGTATSSNRGRTLTHEIGHWLGLYHPFQGGCTTNPNWTDQVDDTPPVASSNSSRGCPLGNNTCNNDNPNQIDNVQNYMDYSNGSCQNMFTEGQKNRIHNLFLSNTYRGANTVDSSDDNGTGVFTNPVCSPIADFHTANLNTILCQGAGEVTFTDHSYNTEVINRTWYFEGGTPATSTDANPTIKYDSSGLFQVKLVVSNGSGSDSMIRSNFITVLPEVADIKASYGQDFENANFDEDWQIEGDANNGWVRNTVRGATGSASMECQIDANSSTDERYSLILPPVDVSNHGSPLRISFKHAYSRRIATATEILLVTVSENCGQSWRTIKGLTASNGLASVSGNNPGWVPTSASDWGHLSLDISAYSSSTNLMIRFEVLVRAGNSVFIDDINIGQFGLGQDELNLLNQFSIVPNPAQNEVQFHLNENWLNAAIELRDLSGRLLLQSELKHLDQTLNTSSLSNGVYVVYLVKDGIRRSEKLVISR